MNSEYLLDAIGLLDDGLIQEAETYTAQNRRSNYRAWMGWAACLAIVAVLCYGLKPIRMGSNSTASPSNGAPASSLPLPGASTSGGDQFPMEPAGSASNGSSNDLNSSGAGSPASSDLPPGMEEPGNEGDFCAAIMVDGVVYWSTELPLTANVEVDQSAIHTVTSYINTVPEIDGQTNFSQDLSAQYARIKIGQEWKLVVLIDREWVLFDPVPPWEQ